ncbi:hypothetical protein JDV02_000610 [Purpureocillium takamizusanense]|uniref:Aminoglycoside phosphotransferase domain-containing protein n=1 Tax=Purpureocillium takamizusanense TaxID=2060973 RepID=A0A9Q8Q6I3_9HYPO|nr:uncharacterized protein JDV02_000610 [Purpureocillium takamizusanense]UNI13915.1 hypothetical protein JDV02_000610 [Purpureocillium takamizusanense]
MESGEAASNILDPWPTSADGNEWDGKGLLDLVQRGESPFRKSLDIRALIVEIEQSLKSSVLDIPMAYFGAHHFGFHVVLKARSDVIVRVSREDTCNRAYRGSITQQLQLLNSQFELDVYRALVPLGSPFNCGPVYHRDPVLAAARSTSSVRGVSGRRIVVFERAEGEKYDYVRWRALSAEQKSRLLREAADAAARLFEFEPSQAFSSTWMRRRASGLDFQSPPADFPASRQACEVLLKNKVRDTVQRAASNYHGMKKSQLSRLDTLEKTLQQLCSCLLPQPRSYQDENMLYRFVLDHGDFGIHNMTIAPADADNMRITSVFD